MKYVLVSLGDHRHSAHEHSAHTDSRNPTPPSIFHASEPPEPTANMANVELTAGDGQPRAPSSRSSAVAAAGRPRPVRGSRTPCFVVNVEVAMHLTADSRVNPSPAQLPPCKRPLAMSASHGPMQTARSRFIVRPKLALQCPSYHLVLDGVRHLTVDAVCRIFYGRKSLPA